MKFFMKLKLELYLVTGIKICWKKFSIKMSFTQRTKLCLIRMNVGIEEEQERHKYMNRYKVEWTLKLLCE